MKNHVHRIHAPAHFIRCLYLNQCVARTITLTIVRRTDQKQLPAAKSRSCATRLTKITVHKPKPATHHNIVAPARFLQGAMRDRNSHDLFQRPLPARCAKFPKPRALHSVFLARTRAATRLRRRATLQKDPAKSRQELITFPPDVAESFPQTPVERFAAGRARSVFPAREVATSRRWLRRLPQLRTHTPQPDRYPEQTDVRKRRSKMVCK